MILTRTEFVTHWNTISPTDPVDRPDHPLWIPETEIKPGAPSEWFVLAPAAVNEEDFVSRVDFWSWCETTLVGQVRCYMLDEREGGDWAWWGFTNKKDITVFLLRWS